eukprot:1158927-Pelagomonas_calceolata.AAC.12
MAFGSTGLVVSLTTTKRRGLLWDMYKLPPALLCRLECDVRQSIRLVTCVHMYFMHVWMGTRGNVSAKMHPFMIDSALCSSEALFWGKRTSFGATVGKAAGLQEVFLSPDVGDVNISELSNQGDIVLKRWSANVVNAPARMQAAMHQVKHYKDIL